MIIIKNNKYHNGSRPPKQNLPRLHTAQSIPVCVLFLGSSKLWLSFVLHKNTFNKQQQKRRADYVGVLRYELEKRFSTFLLSLSAAMTNIHAGLYVRSSSSQTERESA